MSNKIMPTIMLFVVVLALSSPALALNPQPEPPIYYHGYEYVIKSLGDDRWRWEVLTRVDGRPPQALSHGSIHGAHDQAVSAARRAIDHLAASRSPR